MADKYFYKSLARKFLNGVVGFLVVFGVVYAWQWIFYNYFDGYQLPTVTEPIVVLNEDNEIAIGDPIELFLEIDKPELIRAEVNINITCDDGNLVTMAALGNTLPAGQFTRLLDSYKLPPKVAIGSVCKFNFINIYNPNPYKQEILTWSSEEFTVIE